jgi:hypothetical protein
VRDPVDPDDLKTGIDLLERELHDARAEAQRIRADLGQRIDQVDNYFPSLGVSPSTCISKYSFLL